MEFIQKIEYARNLEAKKAELEKELAKVNMEINDNKYICAHIPVDLGYYGYFPSTGNKYRCLLCGKGKTEFFYQEKFMIHAEDFLNNFDKKDESKWDDKFEKIQLLALKILIDSPSIELPDFVDKLNNIIKVTTDYPNEILEEIMQSYEKEIAEKLNKSLSVEDGVTLSKRITDKK